MQSKLVVNILALVALLGLTTFGVVSIIDFNDTIIDQRKISDKSKQVIENHDIVDANVNLQTNLIKLKEKNKSLQESIFQNEITQGALVESVLDLENEKALVVRELEALEKKKLELSAILFNLQKKVEGDGLVLSEKLKTVSDERNNYEQIILELTDLKARERDLQRKIITLKDGRDKVVTELNLKVVGLQKELELVNSEVLENQNSSELKIMKLTSRIGKLSAENQKQLTLLENQKRNYLKQLEQEKLERAQLIKSDIELAELKQLKSNFERLDGLRVIFSGNMIYDESKSQIVFKADNSIEIPIFQDDFTGSIAGKCGLPIDKDLDNRCSATIIAEFVVANSGLFLKGKEIVEIVRK